MGDACSSLGIRQFPALTDNNAFEAVNHGLTVAVGEVITLSKDILAEVYCATTREGPCYGICPNADLAGLGVRLAFYFQAALNALLVALSPEDSPGAAWGATLLTAAIVIPAMVQKKELQLSLYHATLVLNFSTLSSLASLAVAPLCPIWREKGLAEPYKQRQLDDLATPNLSEGDLSEFLDDRPTLYDVRPVTPSDSDDEPDEHVPGHHAPNKKEVTYQRIVLSMALLAQVALQWAYAILLFTSPYFAEKTCNRTTVVVLFGVPLRADDINENWFWVWILWLVFNMGATFVWGAFLVLSGAASKNDTLHSDHSRIRRWMQKVDPTGDKRRLIVMTGALFLAVFFLGVSEAQQRSNCFAVSENSDWGFGQVAALLLVLVPIWQIVVVLNNRWFGGVRRKLSRHLQSRAEDRRSDYFAPRDSDRNHGLGSTADPPQILSTPVSGAASSLYLSASSGTLRSRV